jgi:exosome complex component RRP4
MRLGFDALRERESPMQSSGSLRPIVIPGEAVGGPGLKPGPGTYSEGGRLFAAQLGIRNERDGQVSVIPLSGRYIPQRGDAVIGEVVDLGPSHWLVDINSPYPAPLHATESPWRVEFGDTARYLKVGDVIMAHVLSVDEIKRVQLTMQEREARRLNGGIVMEVSPTKVPRVIGKQGSMVSLIKDLTGCRIYVGENGRIWLDGEDPNTALAAKAIRLIEERAQAFGLTEAVQELIEQETRAQRGHASS